MMAIMMSEPSYRIPRALAESNGEKANCSPETFLALKRQGFFI